MRSFEIAEVQSEIETKAWIPLLRRGELDDDTIRDDVQRILTFYEGSGYLDARVGSHIELSPDNREAKVVFLIEEGPRYLVGSIGMERFDGSPLTVFTPSQLSALLPLRFIFCLRTVFDTPFRVTHLLISCETRESLTI